ncbi:murein biosynthesis integral membrane protein MurJ [Buchnera aphidicola (Mindarus keteleerifoliae)]|uniref:murein biosynthesis integral membrane protein MurJ n=1 Tax=Buchnera aphidicola TaxID=9 RepID=UPI0031B68F2A
MKLFKRLVSVGVITILSRLLSCVRDVYIAYSFGVCNETDAFFIAFKIPNFFRRVFSEGAFSQVLIPILSKIKNKKKLKEIKKVLSGILGLVIFLLSIITLLGIFNSRKLVLLIAPGFLDDHKKLELTIKLLTVTFPYMFFVSITIFISSILNAWNYFIIPSFSPIILNISVISSIFFISDFFDPPILSMAWGIVVSGVIQFLYQIPLLKKINMFIVPSINIFNVKTLRILKKMSLSVFSVSINQISLVINSIVSSLLVSGSISWVYYAERLIEFPSGILSFSISTIVLPLLSKKINFSTLKKSKKVINWALKITIIFSFPSSIALIILSKYFVLSLFQYGKFTFYDTLMTQKVLIFYSIGLVAFIINKIFFLVFYSINDIKTPTSISLVSFFLTQILNLILIPYFQHSGFALSISISSWISILISYLKLSEKRLLCFQYDWVCFLFKVTLSVFFMSILMLIMLHFFSYYFFLKMMNRLIILFIICLIGIIGYFSFLFLLGICFSVFFCKF